MPSRFLVLALVFGLAMTGFTLSASPQFGKKKKPAVDVNAPMPATTTPAPKASGPLKIVEASVAQMEDGESIDAANRFVPGETIFFSFLVENYKAGPNGRVELTAEIETLDPKGTTIAAKFVEQVKTTLAEEDKDWKPKLRQQIQVPSIAHPGTYMIRYKITDVQTSQVASGERKFVVTGPEVEPGDSLAVRQFGFYRGEEDLAPLSVAAYRPGDTLWARFFITGYKYGPENSVDVAYDVAVVNPEGKEIFSQKDAAVEKSKAFYPQPWVPGGINLNLQANMRPGTYSVTITARDAKGNQTITAKNEFRVE